jgi:hypothetical protein
MDFNKMAINTIKFALGFAVGMMVYNKFLGGSSTMESVDDDGSDTASQGDEE